MTYFIGEHIDLSHINKQGSVVPKKSFTEQTEKLWEVGTRIIFTTFTPSASTRLDLSAA